MSMPVSIWLSNEARHPGDHGSEGQSELFAKEFTSRETLVHAGKKMQHVPKQSAFLPQSLGSRKPPFQGGHLPMSTTLSLTHLPGVSLMKGAPRMRCTTRRTRNPQLGPE